MRNYGPMKQQLRTLINIGEPIAYHDPCHKSERTD